MSSPFQQRFSKSSPLKQGAYESAADNAVYLSTQPAMQAMQNAITEVGVAAIKAAGDPARKAKRQDKRADRRDKRSDKKIASGEFVAGVEAKDAVKGVSYKEWAKRFSSGETTSIQHDQAAVVGVEGNQEWKDFQTNTDKIRGKAKDNALKAKKIKENNQRRCKGKSAGKHKDSEGPYTCS